MPRHCKLVIEGGLQLQEILRRGVPEDAKLVQLLLELNVKLVPVVRRIRHRFEKQVDFGLQRFESHTNHR